MLRASLHHSSTMDNCPLPIEVCELIIDLVPIAHTWWQEHVSWRDRPCTYVKFTHICSAWLPRARFILYDTIIFCHSRQVDLFCRSIEDNPFLAEMVHTLIIEPLSGHTYIPFTRFTLLNFLSNLKGLLYDMRHVDMWMYPPRHHHLVPLHSITTLVITHMQDRSRIGTEVYRLIWSLRRLETLQLDLDSARINEIDVQHLNIVRRPWACSALKSLTLTVSLR